MERANVEKEVGFKTRKVRNKKGRFVVGVIMAVVIVALGVFAWFQFKEIKQLRDPSYAAEQATTDAAKLKDKVAKLIELPDETATVATVTDAEKLKGQDFFKNTENGDKVLIFPAAKKAVIYRESDNKVINAGPIILSSSSVNEQ
ncbi:hypothetical protein FWD20_00170 [Candidatus Saccharibacteria bacterium]|nr:hypothetical protein [Candidatus Saccharibacteria bacterium]